MNVFQRASIVGLVCAGLACEAPSAFSPDEQKPAAKRASTSTATVSADPIAMAAAMKAFDERIRAYIDFHNNVEKMVPPLKETTDPQKIAGREKALGEQLIKSRPGAKEGDFFVPEVQPYLAKMIKDDFAKRSLADRKALIQELPNGFKLVINTPYPTTLPLLTFPANLLNQLPQLPEELQYRIVGRNLILLDIKGSVIVDVMRDVFPIGM